MHGHIWIASCTLNFVSGCLSVLSEYIVSFSGWCWLMLMPCSSFICLFLYISFLCLAYVILCSTYARPSRICLFASIYYAIIFIIFIAYTRRAHSEFYIMRRHRTVFICDEKRGTLYAAVCACRSFNTRAHILLYAEKNDFDWNWRVRMVNECWLCVSVLYDVIKRECGCVCMCVWMFLCNCVSLCAVAVFLRVYTLYLINGHMILFSICSENSAIFVIYATWTYRLDIWTWCEWQNLKRQMGKRGWDWCIVQIREQISFFPFGRSRIILSPKCTTCVKPRRS